MAVAKTSKHRANIAHYTRLGYSADEIAGLLGIAVKTVYNNLAALTKIWKEEGIQDTNAYRMGAHELIERFKVELVREWERSKKPEVTVKTRVVDGATEYTETTTRERCANPQYIALAIAATEKQLSILGIENPSDPTTRIPHKLDDAYSDLVKRLDQINRGSLN